MTRRPEELVTPRPGCRRRLHEFLAQPLRPRAFWSRPRAWGVNINEADYADKDVLDFHFGGFRLARATAARVTD
jgi:hypothetical protein